MNEDYEASIMIREWR